MLGYTSDEEFIACATISRKFVDHEVAWYTNRKELAAIVKSIQHWDSKLRGRYFTIYTDHKALVYELASLPKLPRVLVVWANFLSQFSYDICHIPGKDNIFADLLSRTPDTLSSLPSQFTHPSTFISYLDHLNWNTIPWTSWQFKKGIPLRTWKIPPHPSRTAKTTEKHTWNLWSYV